MAAMALKTLIVMTAFGISLIWIYFDIFSQVECTCSKTDQYLPVQPDLRLQQAFSNDSLMLEKVKQIVRSEIRRSQEELREQRQLVQYNTPRLKPFLAEKQKQNLSNKQHNVPLFEEKQSTEIMNTNLPVEDISLPADSIGDQDRLEISEDNRFYVLTMLKLSNGTTMPNYWKFNKKDLQERDDEYLQTIEANINNPVVKELHLFYVDDDSVKALESRNYANREKITLIKMNRTLHMADFFLYASEYLVDKPVIAMNGDIIIGDGFDQIDTKRMRDEKVMYSLTRYDKIKKQGHCVPQNMGLPKGYFSSHDTHIFRLAEPLNETLILDKLDYPINMWGAENALMWTFRFMLKYAVRNPAKVLSTYHNHCSKVHGPIQKNIGKHQYSIYFLEGKGWTRKHVLASAALYEDQLAYGNLKT